MGTSSGFRYGTLSPEVLAMSEELEQLGGGGDARVAKLQVFCKAGSDSSGAEPGIVGSGEDGNVAVRDPRCPADTPASEAHRRYRIPLLGREPAVWEKARQEVLEWLEDGFNCTVLAYGQAGTGKTHSVLGLTHTVSLGSGSFLSETLDGLFRLRASSGGTWRISVSSWEMIGGDTMTDLLAPAPPGVGSSQHASGAQQGNFLSVEVRSLEEMEQALRHSRSRSCNWAAGADGVLRALSNRAHAFLRLQLLNPATGRLSTLHLVDLVGSRPLEGPGSSPRGSRPADPLSQAERERRTLNRQMLAFSRVVSELSQQEGIVAGGAHNIAAARETKLTAALTPLIAANTRAIVLATVSPRASDFLDTINTLRVSSRLQSLRVACMRSGPVDPERLRWAPASEALSLLAQAPPVPRDASEAAAPSASLRSSSSGRRRPHSDTTRQDEPPAASFCSSHNNDAGGGRPHYSATSTRSAAVPAQSEEPHASPASAAFAGGRDVHQHRKAKTPRNSSLGSEEDNISSPKSLGPTPEPAFPTLAPRPSPEWDSVLQEAAGGMSAGDRHSVYSYSSTPATAAGSFAASKPSSRHHEGIENAGLPHREPVGYAGLYAAKRHGQVTPSAAPGDVLSAAGFLSPPESPPSSRQGGRNFTYEHGMVASPERSMMHSSNGPGSSSGAMLQAQRGGITPLEDLTNVRHHEAHADRKASSGHGNRVHAVSEYGGGGSYGAEGAAGSVANNTPYGVDAPPAPDHSRRGDQWQIQSNQPPRSSYYSYGGSVASADGPEADHHGLLQSSSRGMPSIGFRPNPNSASGHDGYDHGRDGYEYQQPGAAMTEQLGGTGGAGGGSYEYHRQQQHHHEPSVALYHQAAASNNNNLEQASRGYGAFAEHASPGGLEAPRGQRDLGEFSARQADDEGSRRSANNASTYDYGASLEVGIGEELHEEPRRSDGRAHREPQAAERGALERGEDNHFSMTLRPEGFASATGQGPGLGRLSRVPESPPPAPVEHEGAAEALGLPPGVSDNVQAQVAALKGQNDWLVGLLEHERKTSEALKAKLEEADMDLNEIAAQYEVKLSTARQELVEHRSRCRKLEAETQVAAVFEDYNREIHTLQASVSHLRDENSDLINIVSSLQSKKSHGGSSSGAHQGGRPRDASEVGVVGSSAADEGAIGPGGRMTQAGRVQALQRQLRRAEADRDKAVGEAEKLKRHGRTAELLRSQSEGNMRRVRELQQRLAHKEKEAMDRGLAAAEAEGKADMLQVEMTRLREVHAATADENHALKQSVGSLRQAVSGLRQPRRREVVEAALPRVRGVAEPGPGGRGSSSGRGGASSGRPQQQQQRRALELVRQIEREIPAKNHRVDQLVNRLLAEISEHASDMQRMAEREAALMRIATGEQHVG